MAYVKIINSRNLSFIYNVHKAVGPNSPNQRVDVLLVQYLLKTIFSNTVALEMTALPSGRAILVDGIFGPITAEAILHFQQQVKAKGQAIATDGRTDRSFPADKTPSGLQWTIIFMNFAFKHVRPNDHANLPAAVDCPSELRAALM